MISKCRISPHNVDTWWDRTAIRIKKTLIHWGILSDPSPNSQGWNREKCLPDSKENWHWDPRSVRVHCNRFLPLIKKTLPFNERFQFTYARYCSKYLLKEDMAQNIVWSFHHQFGVYLFVRLSVHPPVCLSILPSILLSVCFSMIILSLIDPVIYSLYLWTTER